MLFNQKSLREKLQFDSKQHGEYIRQINSSMMQPGYHSINK